MVATGGGALNDPLNRWDLWAHGTAVWLDASADALARRLATDQVQRPLLGHHPAAGLALLADERAPFYRAADLRTDADRPAWVVVDELTREAPPARRRLFDAQVPRHHPIGPPHTQVVFGVDLELPVDARSSLIIDARLSRLQPALVGALGAGRCLPITGGERAKRMRTLERLLGWLATSRAERRRDRGRWRRYRRRPRRTGCRAVRARSAVRRRPTTWLAQADAALGGKVGVDLAAAKNAVGAFWPPWSVFADVGMLPKPAAPTPAGRAGRGRQGGAHR